MNKKLKVVAIVGTTASGKTALSIEIAKQYNGEVVSADSRQVYRGLDLGTGKVTLREMAEVPHHLLDVAEPMQVYTGSDFVRDARIALTNIITQGKVPVVAGGTFFYLDLLRGRRQSAPVEPNEAFRESLRDYSNASLHEKLYTADPARAAAIDPHNRRRLIRALEIVEVLGSVPSIAEATSPYDWLIIGLNVSEEILHKNIHTRLHERIAAGMIEEARQLHNDGMTYERMEALGLEYRYQARYLQKQITLDEMKTQIETKTRQFAKRQRTWLNADESIEWFIPEDRRAIFECITSFLHEERS